MRRFSVLITDLDNTLYDWVEMWAATFGTLLRGIVSRSGLSQGQLEREIRAIHRKYGTSEYSFLIQEIPSLQQLHPGEDLRTVYGEAIAAAAAARRQAGTQALPRRRRYAGHTQAARRSGSRLH